MDDAILVIDEGTTSTRAMLFAADGACLGSAGRELSQHYPRPGWVEHDPEEIWTATLACAGEMVAAAGGFASSLLAASLLKRIASRIAWRKTTRHCAAAIGAHPAVRAVHADEPVRAHMDESVDYVNAPAAWQDPGVTGAGQSVAVLDTGIDWTHPMFGADVTPPSDLHEKVKHYETWTAGHHDAHGHGTHVAGTAAGASKYGDTLLGPARFDGPAKDADIWAYKVLSDAGTGLTQSVVMGIESAAARGADVQNLSLGSDDGDPSSPTSRAVNNATAAGSTATGGTSTW